MGMTYARQMRWTGLPAHQGRRPGPVDLWPVFHRLSKHVRGHVLICMVGACLTWHLRQAQAPLTDTDAHPPAQPNPVAAAGRSAAAEAKAALQHDADGRPAAASAARSNTRPPRQNQVRSPGTQATVPVLTEPTSEQRQAFNLVGAACGFSLRTICQMLASPSRAVSRSRPSPLVLGHPTACP